jgi:hypothetical protein
MKTRKAQWTFAILAVFVSAGIGTSRVAGQDAAAQTGPVYNLEGAWSGIVTLTSGFQVPTLDNFTGNTRKPGVEGSVLCTIPVTTWPHPDHPGDPQYYLVMTASGHGNWVRIDTNTVAYTAVRTLVDQRGLYYGRAVNWGKFTATSENEFEGTMTMKLYRVDGTTFRTLVGTAHSYRVEIVREE